MLIKIDQMNEMNNMDGDNFQVGNFDWNWEISRKFVGNF